MMPDTWIVHCDGSAVPNPGRMGMGAVIVSPDGTRRTLSRAGDERGCNNEAELRAVMMALRTLKASDVSTLQIYSDNSVLVAQLDGTGDTPPIARLATMFDEARGLISTFEHVVLQWIPRHRNAEADALARAALGLPPKQTVKPAKTRKQARQCRDQSCIEAPQRG